MGCEGFKLPSSQAPKLRPLSPQDLLRFANMRTPSDESADEFSDIPGTFRHRAQEGRFDPKVPFQRMTKLRLRMFVWFTDPDQGKPNQRPTRKQPRGFRCIYIYTLTPLHVTLTQQLSKLSIKSPRLCKSAPCQQRIRKHSPKAILVVFSLHRCIKSHV